MKGWCATDEKGRDFGFFLKQVTKTTKQRRSFEKFNAYIRNFSCFACCRTHSYLGDCIGRGGVPAITSATGRQYSIPLEEYFEPYLEHPPHAHDAKFMPIVGTGYGYTQTKTVEYLADTSEGKYEHTYIPPDLSGNSQEIISLWKSACATGLFKRIFEKVNDLKTSQDIERVRKVIEVLSEPTTIYPNLQTPKARGEFKLLREFFEGIVTAFPNGTEHAAGYEVAALVVQIAGKTLKKGADGPYCIAYALFVNHLYNDGRIMDADHLLDHLNKRWDESRGVAALTQKRKEHNVWTGICQDGVIKSNFALIWGCSDPTQQYHAIPPETDLDLGVRITAVRTGETIKCNWESKRVTIPNVVTATLNFDDRGGVGNTGIHSENICVEYNPASNETIEITVVYNYYTGKNDAKVYGGFVQVSNSIPGKDGTFEDNYDFPWPQKVAVQGSMGKPIREVVASIGPGGTAEYTPIPTDHKYRLSPEMFQDAEATDETHNNFTDKAMRTLLLQRNRVDSQYGTITTRIPSVAELKHTVINKNIVMDIKDILSGRKGQKSEMITSEGHGAIIINHKGEKSGNGYELCLFESNGVPKSAMQCDYRGKIVPFPQKFAGTEARVEKSAMISTGPDETVYGPPGVLHIIPAWNNYRMNATQGRCLTHNSKIFLGTDAYSNRNYLNELNISDVNVDVALHPTIGIWIPK